MEEDLMQEKFSNNNSNKNVTKIPHLSKGIQYSRK
jgi:hypothetical protein